MSQTSNKSLIKELETIRQSLDEILENAEIPTLDDIIDQAALGQKSLDGINPDNPFLSSDSLSELIKIRNEAVARLQESKQAANANKPSITSASSASTTSAQSPSQTPTGAAQEAEPLIPNEQSAEAVTLSADADQLIAHMDSCFRSWKNQLVRKYVKKFEQELNSQLEHDFQLFVQEQLKQHQLTETDQLLNRRKPPSK
ncbi:hypothetical protein [Reinekea thalattae]|uniref:Uncharacterized protein n=1 Tax=Reinekea thalattae TaxID=2593301 RepID=A0A5C8Z9A2_9GAMM|nr:hypothetical protein [Reinekea thalattae]TXR53798.1 hypothetical protein FME95_04365 [Reinekea thalattae]